MMQQKGLRHKIINFICIIHLQVSCYLCTISCMQVLILFLCYCDLDLALYLHTHTQIPIKFADCYVNIWFFFVWDDKNLFSLCMEIYFWVFFGSFPYFAIALFSLQGFPSHFELSWYLVELSVWEITFRPKV